MGRDGEWVEWDGMEGGMGWNERLVKWLNG